MVSLIGKDYQKTCKMNMTAFVCCLVYDRLSFRFNKSATSLSGIFRDPNDTKRGILTIMPKWLGDTNIASRRFLVVKRVGDNDLFDYFSGHLSYLIGSGSQELSQVCEGIK